MSYYDNTEFQNERNELQNEVNNEPKNEIQNKIQTDYNPVVSNSTSDDSITFQLDETTTKNMKFISLMYKIGGILAIIGGAMYCLSIIGAILGVPIIFVGIKLFNAASDLESSVLSKDGKQINKFFENSATALKIYLITFIASFVIMFLFIFLTMFIAMLSRA